MDTGVRLRSRQSLQQALVSHNPSLPVPPTLTLVVTQSTQNLPPDTRDTPVISDTPIVTVAATATIHDLIPLLFILFLRVHSLCICIQALQLPPSCLSLSLRSGPPLLHLEVERVLRLLGCRFT